MIITIIMITYKKMKKEKGSVCFLISKEGETIEVPKNIATISVLVQEMIGKPGEPGYDELDEPYIPLPNVNTNSLRKIVEFMRYYKNNKMQNIEKPLKTTKIEDIVGEWYSNFVDISQSLLFDLLLSANYMDIQSLLDLTCVKIASMIKGKTVEQIRATFDITCEFSKEEKDSIIMSNHLRELL